MTSSFFDKLKKGMGTEGTEEKSPKVELPEVKKEEKKELPKKNEKKEEKWPKPEGELAIDVYQTENDLVIQSAIAGVKKENLEIEIEEDMLTIKGMREKPFAEEEGEYLTQECYWGAFSRKMILPVEVDIDKSEADLKEGILTIRIPKLRKERKRRIIVKP